MVEAAREGWPKEVEGLRRFTSRRRDKANRPKKERSTEPKIEATPKRE